MNKWPPRLAESHHGHDGWDKSIVPVSAKETRRFVGTPCSFCNTPMTKHGSRRVTREHLFPKSRGFNFQSLNGLNKALVCSTCNQDKDSHNVVDWWWHLEQSGDNRAPKVFLVVERLWFNGALPDLLGPAHAEATRRLKAKDDVRAGRVPGG